MTIFSSDPAIPARVLVLGNEKGGCGKSTTAMHLIAAMLQDGVRVAALDLDARQGTLTRYVENRRAFIEQKGVPLPLPTLQTLPSRDSDEQNAERVAAAVAALSAEHDCLVVDTPGSDSALSRAGHSHADVLITPLNDSFVDLDGLGRFDPDTHAVRGPGPYAQMVFEQKLVRARREGRNRTFDWIVIRNRTGHLDSRNRQAMDRAVAALAKRIGFRTAPGFAERVIFRELFLQGLTLLDMRRPGAVARLNLSHLAARQEVRSLLRALNLPAGPGPSVP